ncbi:Hypothetical protein LUCI_0672 [Lucifera butyrica]|uniref:PRD domain-containing protein n=1 Tax=Lucifera butyrica TaxID=1351585 RepID=A0A498R5C9_9FIRM|nr:PRD domain-containing protein [Lucifera butyrica]VBB05462.1 Hypothetical protein LUCI_0672 [Lucifera butyrica]
MRQDHYTLVKVFNNNVVLALRSGREEILFARGIGFGRKSGDTILAATPVEKKFTIMDAGNSGRFRQLLTQVDDAVFAMCEAVIAMISSELNEELNENIHINLVEHIAFMLKRVRRGEEFTNPFMVETEILYEKEYLLAQKAVAMLEQQAGVQIPEGEAGFIAIHIHSARKNGKLSQTMRQTFLANSLVEIIEEERQIAVDRQSLDYARFVTHLRYTMERLLRRQRITNDLLPVIRRKYKASYALAEQLSAYIAEELEVEVPVGETAYIALYVEKLCVQFPAGQMGK